MTIPPSISTVLGALAGFATAALVAIEAILARELISAASVSIRILAIVSSALEGIAFLLLCAYLFCHLATKKAAKTPAVLSGQEKQPRQPQQTSRSGVWLGLSIAFCTIAAAVSVAALVTLGKTAHSLPDTIFGTGVVSFLVGASVTLGVCYFAQLLFLVAQLIAARLPLADRRLSESLRTAEGGGYSRTASNGADGANSRSNSNGSRSSPSAHVKSIRYSQTLSPDAVSSRGRKDKMSSARGNSAEYHTPPGSSGGRSAAETMSSIRTSLSHAVRPISSKTKLLSSGHGSQRSSHQGTSLTASPASSSGAEDGFDSWDTSAVDPQNRQAVLETAASPIAGSRFLETIPASPTASRSPSPGTPLDLDPPRTRRRSRSYSPTPSTARSIGGRVRSQSHSHSTTNEAHIHPLFRSDSPTPPPAVSAGTVVTASPNAGQVINLHNDLYTRRTISRMRSGSLPAVPSPLSRQGSFDDFSSSRRGATSAAGDRSRGACGSSEELREEDAEVAGEEGNSDAVSQANSTERKMTPPIPEWILSAGARTSLSGYESRKVRIEDGAL